MSDGALVPIDGVARFLPAEAGHYEVRRADLDGSHVQTARLVLDPAHGADVCCPCLREHFLGPERVRAEGLQRGPSIGAEDSPPPLVLTDIGFVCPRGKECPIGHRYDVTVRPLVAVTQEDPH